MHARQKLVAVVLAGGLTDPLAQQEKVASKALIELNGKPMVAYVLESVRQVSGLSHISLVGSKAKAYQGLVDACVSAGESLADSFQAGLKLALKQQPDKILFITADLPWITSRALEAFIAAPEADVLYAAIPEAFYQAQFPGQKRTYARFKEGKFTAGNVLLLKPEAAKKLLPFLNKLYQGRKNPLRLAQILGFATVFALALGRLDLPGLEQRVSQRLGLKARVFIASDASLGADIDKLEHLLEARKLAGTGL